MFYFKCERINNVYYVFEEFFLCERESKKKYKKGIYDIFSLGNRWKVKNFIMDNFKEIKKIIFLRYE